MKHNLRDEGLGAGWGGNLSGWEWNGGERGRESSRRKSGEGLGSEKAEWRLRKGRGYWDKYGFYTDRSRTSARQKSKGAKK